MSETTFRHEKKLAINYIDWAQLRSHLKYVAKPDEHAGADGSYRIRSLYFDNYRDKAVVEKLAGMSHREKFRFRYYGDDTGFIRLEKKSKHERMTNKQAAAISAGLCQDIIKGDHSALLHSDSPVLIELYEKMQTQLLRPKTIVDYKREAYVYGPGNVRITIDSCIRTSAHVGDFLKPESITVPATGITVLEIKYEAFLPDIIRDALQLNARHETEFSKYVVSRIAI